MSESIDNLKLVFNLTKTMLQSAKEGEWASVAQLQQRRTTLFETTFPLPEKDNSEQVQSLIKEIISINQQVEQLGQEEKQALQLELSGLHKNKKAVSAYRST